VKLAAAMLATALATTGSAAVPYRPAFDPSAFKAPAYRAPNRVAVLGTSHLAGLPKSFDPATLRPLIARLAAWRPTAIAVENVPGTQCAMLRQYPARYHDSVADYCWDPAPARAATGLDVPAAATRVEELLAAWSAAPTAARRRNLAATLMAAGESHSALVQWLRLAPAERRAGDGLDPVLVQRLEQLRTRQDEVAQIAAPLAAALGLERLVSMDDHSADRPTPPADEAAYGKAITLAWNNPASTARKAESERLQRQLGTGNGVLATYRAYNAHGQGRLIFDSDFGAQLKERSTRQFGRNYVTYWETRNLRMAANIRDGFGAVPGTRTLVLVGASHKPYLEAYLDQMHDVQLTDPLTLLR
jgi:Family of unknown function (DUF5694)